MAGVEACQNLQKERYAVNQDTSIVQFRQPGSVEDPLTGEHLSRPARRRKTAAAKAKSAKSATKAKK